MTRIMENLVNRTPSSSIVDLVLNKQLFILIRYYTRIQYCIIVSLFIYLQTDSSIQMIKKTYISNFEPIFINVSKSNLNQNQNKGRLL